MFVGRRANEKAVYTKSAEQEDKKRWRQRECQSAHLFSLDAAVRAICRERVEVMYERESDAIRSRSFNHLCLGWSSWLLECYHTEYLEGLSMWK